MACINACMVVGPTNFQPRFFKSLDSAWEAADSDRLWATELGGGSKRHK